MAFTVDPSVALEAENFRLKKECEHLRMQIGYIATELMVAGDKRSLPEIVETAAEATAKAAGCS